MNHAVQHIETEERAEWADPSRGTDQEREELFRRRTEYMTTKVHGLDLNPGLVRAAKMNMVMNNDGSGGLFQADTLANPRSWSHEAAHNIRLGSFDCVVANPPFGANIVIDDQEILEQFDLAAMWDREDDGAWTMRHDRNGRPVLQKSQPPEILFIERCVQLLKPGVGRFALVIPNGILNNPALGYVRTWLMQNTQVLAIVDMARELFQPKNDTQTSMVLARRLDATEREAAIAGQLEYPIFMATTERLGTTSAATSSTGAPTPARTYWSQGPRRSQRSTARPAKRCFAPSRCRTDRLTTTCRTLPPPTAAGSERRSDHQHRQVAVGARPRPA
ncbi:N-6 DNA methylase [Mycolicibacterium sp. XJ2546]